jgi:hypothetical protein
VDTAGRTDPEGGRPRGDNELHRVRVPAAAWGALAVGVSLAVHAPVLDSWFHNDDLLHLYQLANFGFVEFVMAAYGGHLYAVRNAVFATAHGLFGLWSSGYLALLLLTHLVNVALLFAVLRSFFGVAALAGLGALLWGIAPVHRGVLGWYSAHGIALTATILLWLLLDLARARSGSLQITRARTLGWAALLLAAALSYGVGVALAIFFPLVARLLLPEGALDRRGFAILLLVALATPLLYAGLWTLPTLEGGERGRGLQLTVLYPPAWLYMLRTITALFGYGFASLLLGPFVALGREDPLNAAMLARRVGAGPLAALDVESVSVGLGLLGGAFLVGVLLVSSRVRRDERRLLLGFAAVGAIGYGMIAVGRAFWGMMLQTAPEVLATTARYQYIGSIAVCLFLCWGLLRLRPRGPRGRLVAVIGLSIGVAIQIAASTPILDRMTPSNPRARPEFERFEKIVARAAATSPSDATVYVRNRPFNSVDLGPERPEHFPGYAAVWVLSQESDEIEGRPIRFVEQDTAMVARLRAGRDDRVTRLVVTPAECGNCVAR